MWFELNNQWNLKITNTKTHCSLTSVSFVVENSCIVSFLRLCFVDESRVILKSLRWLIVGEWQGVVHILLLATAAVHVHKDLDPFLLFHHQQPIECN